MKAYVAGALFHYELISDTDEWTVLHFVGALLTR